MKSRFVSFVLCVVGFSVAAVAGEQGRGAPQAPLVAVGKVGESENVEVRRYTGRVTSSAEVQLVARVSGELLRVGFNEGDMVERGQVLYELDPVRYEAAVMNAEAKIKEAEARRSYAEISFSRNDELFKKKATTKDSRDSAESEFDATQAAVLSAQATLITARDDLKNTKILAPIRGKIGTTSFTEGNYLTPSSGVIATVIQLDPLRVNFSMSNRDFLSMFGNEAGLKENAEVRLKLADGSLYPLVGAVEYIDNHVNTRTDTLQVSVRFENPDLVLVPGSSLEVLLYHRNGTSLPAVVPSAVMHDSKSAYVYVLDDDNRVERRVVELGTGTASLQLIKSGLEPGERIVIDGTHKARPGSVVDVDFRG